MPAAVSGVVDDAADFALKTMAAATAEGWQVTKVAGALGAEVRGLDLENATPADAALISDLLVEYGVLFFPDQVNLTQEGHERFGHLFGKTAGHPNLPKMNKGDIFELKTNKTNRPSGNGLASVADEWHTDLTCEESPPLYSVLRIVKLPEVGGDTMWTSLGAAYEALSPPMQAVCDGLTALHTAQTHGFPDKGTIHPVVRKHPVSGRKLLYVNQVFTKRIVEVSAEESNLLLPYLQKWVTDPRFNVRHAWKPHDVAMWDNRATQHCVVNDFDPSVHGERIAQRVTIQGDSVEAGAPEALRFEPFPGRSQDDRLLIQHLRKMGKIPGRSKM